MDEATSQIGVELDGKVRESGYEHLRVRLTVLFL